MRVLAAMTQAMRLTNDLQLGPAPMGDDLRCMVLDAANQAGITIGQYLIQAAGEKALAQRPLMSASDNDNQLDAGERVFLRDQAVA